MSHTVIPTQSPNSHLPLQQKGLYHSAENAFSNYLFQPYAHSLLSPTHNSLDLKHPEQGQTQLATCRQGTLYNTIVQTYSRDTFNS